MGIVFIIHPKICGNSSEDAAIFYDSLVNELEKYILVTCIKSRNQISIVSITDSDAIVFFNFYENYCLDYAVIAILEQAKKNGSKIFPVAICKEFRKPPSIIEEIQSFDVYDRLRQVSLPEGAQRIIASELSRIIICSMHPTLTNYSMKCFLSHKRVDGEDIAAEVDSLLKAMKRDTFRDIANIKVSENTQQIIESELSKCDVFILLDTPSAERSVWIEKEIQLALSQNIPIVWIRFSENGNISNLSIKPAKEPHFEKELPVSKSDLNIICDAIIDIAFELHRANAQKALNYLSMLIKLNNENKIMLKEVDTCKLIYEITIPRFGVRYPELPRRHVVQIFGKNPTVSDCSAFRDYVEKAGYKNNSKFGYIYDAAVLARPFHGAPETLSHNMMIDSAVEYISEITRMTKYVKSNGKAKKGVVISGSFTDVNAVFQQRILDAVNIFARAILNRGSVLIFGGHPTFTPLILGIRIQMEDEAEKELIHLYQSKYFIDEAVAEKYENRAKVFLTENVDVNRDKSLTKMRESMLMDDNACALIAIGGRKEENGYMPGVLEEVNIAIKNNLPVFIIGSTGGQAYKLASERVGWDRNGLDLEENKRLMNGVDYEELADLVLSRLDS